MKCAQVGGFCLLLSLATVQSAPAEPVLFSTLADGDTYNPFFSFAIGGPHNVRQAQQFMPTAEGRVSSLELGLVLSRTDNVLALLLTNDDNQPGSVIDSFLFSGNPAPRRTAKADRFHSQ